MNWLKKMFHTHDMRWRSREMIERVTVRTGIDNLAEPATVYLYKGQCLTCRGFYYEKKTILDSLDTKQPFDERGDWQRYEYSTLRSIGVGVYKPIDGTEFISEKGKSFKRFELPNGETKDIDLDSVRTKPQLHMFLMMYFRLMLDVKMIEIDN